MEEKIIGLVLAGGKSRRFGEQKAFAKYDGKSFLQRSIEALQGITDKMVIVGSSEVKMKLPSSLQKLFIHDVTSFKGKGPLAGIYSGMEYENGDWYFVLPCDMPLVNQEVMNEIYKHRHPSYDIVIPSIYGKIHPLIGLYHPRLKPTLFNLLKNEQYRMMTLIERVNVKYINEQNFINHEVFTNVNDKETLNQIQSLTKERE